MAGKQAPEKASSHRSTVIAGLMIAAAGAIAWFGYQPSGPEALDGPDPGKTVTLAAEQGGLRDTPPGRSGLPTRVRIESAGIDTSVAEVGIVRDDAGPRWETAFRSAGHHINSSRPGNPGNVVLTGHVSVANQSHVPVFANLDRVRVGDIVEVHSGSRVHRYLVEEVAVVEPDAVDVLNHDHRSLVTLITCTPDLEQRLVVVGALVS